MSIIEDIFGGQPKDNRVVSPNPSLKDLLDLLKNDIMLNTNCHAIGTIELFNPLLQTATVTINYKKRVPKKNFLGRYSQELTDYPVLVDCPVAVLQGGLGALTFPITRGDTCLVCFNDRDLDNWFSTGQVRALSSNRMHAFTDAIIIVGLRPAVNPILSYDPFRTSLRHGTTKVALNGATIEISNAAFTLGSLLQELITDVKNLVTQTAAITVPAFGSPPSNAAAITAITAQLTATSSKITGLLQ